MNALRRQGWILLAAAVSLVLTVQPFRDTDVWWHLAVGRYIVAHGIPSSEPFSFLHAANPWVGQQWLYEVLLARAVALGGAALASLAMGMVAAAALVIAMLSIPFAQRPRGPWAAAGLIAGALMAAQLLGVRGQVISLLGSAVVLYVVMRWRQGSRRWLLVLPPVFALWANLHAGFLAGLAIAAVALLTVPGVGRRARLEMAGAAGVAGLATLLNPAGPGLWGYVAGTFDNPTLTSLVAEWQSPDFHNLWLRVFEVGALTLALCWLLAPSRDRFDMILAGIAFAASLQAQRNVSLFAVVAAPQLARYGAAAWHRHRHRLARLSPRVNAPRPAPRWFLTGAAAVLLVAVGLAVAPGLRAAAVTSYEAGHLPKASADYVAQHLGGRRIYSPDTWGGYLAERFPSGRVVYLYDETAVFGDAALQQYLDVHDVRARWPTVIASNAITVAILPVDGQEVSALLTVGWRVDCRDRTSGSLVMTAGTSTVSGDAGEIGDAPAC